jgi:23S rRNA (uracil1939-C5)-methyltransferase
MEQNETFTIAISKMSHEGRGIGRREGKTQFIDNALPDEEVVARRVKSLSKYDEAIATEILTRSPKRIEPHCPHYLVCGGCRLQHLDATAQILFKEDLLKEQLQYTGKCQANEFLPPLQSQSFGYRTKARLAVRYLPHKKKMAIGFREMDGFTIADLNCCPVLNKKFDDLLPELNHLIGQLANFQYISQIEFAMGDHDSAVILRHSRPFVKVDLDRLTQFAKLQQIDLYLHAQGVDTLVKLWPKNHEMSLHYELPNYQLKLAFHPQDFTQINSEINRLMIDQALELLALQPKDKVLDLFCGMGNFSLPIARFAKKVLGIEGNAAMVARAKQNAKLNHLKNADFAVANLTQQFDLIKRYQANKIVIDPPRSGAFEVLPALIALAPERIVYISCNPATLARDSQYLTSNGYQLEKVGVMDMFPQTQHVESMALFVPRKTEALLG